MQETPLVLTVFVKCLAHWLSHSLPLVIASPLLALFMNMDALSVGATALTLLVGTPRSPLSVRCGGGGRRLAAARRASGVDPRPAADHPGADLRCRRGLCGDAGSLALPAAFSLSHCAHLIFAVIGPLAAALALRASSD